MGKSCYCVKPRIISLAKLSNNDVVLRRGTIYFINQVQGDDLPVLGNSKGKLFLWMLLSFFSDNHQIEAGCDEAGRGCLAGPVVAAAVILPRGYTHPELNDSKQLPKKKRDALRIEIEREAICWAVCFVDNNEIDEVNILNASFLAMNRAVDQLKKVPELLLIDGNRYKPHNEIPYECIIKGDGKYYSIAAASILAKTYRDEYMAGLAQQHPEYSWHSNAGYPTIAHREAIRTFGLTDFHRRSFRQLPDQLELFDID